jgi:hypothetical protein
MSNEVSRHLKACRKSWEAGHAILANLANRILAERGLSLVVEKPKHELPSDYAGDLLRAYRTWRTNLLPLMPDLADLSTIDNCTPWMLGPFETLAALVGMDAGQMSKLDWLVAVAGSPRPTWTEDDWRSRWVEPMQRHAAEWRERLARLQEQSGSASESVAEYLGNGKCRVGDQTITLTRHRSDGRRCARHPTRCVQARTY